MTQSLPVVYAVPTHLQEREPFAFGRTLGEVARLVAVGCVAARLVGSDQLPASLRLPVAAVVLLVGASWALLRIQRRPLDDWLALAFRYGATPRQRVWRPSGSRPVATAAASEARRERGRFELERVRVRWAPLTPVSGHGVHTCALCPTGSGGAA